MKVTTSAGMKELVERARDPAVPLQQQHDAFAQLVERTQHLVFAGALSSLRNVEDARDAAQDAFTAAWLSLPRLRDASAFPAWLKRIVSTQCHRRLRRRALDPSPLEGVEPFQPDDALAEHRHLIASAIAGLPEGERHVTVLFYCLGYSQEETARLLDLKPGTVGKRLHDARVRIRRRLPPFVRSAALPLSRTRTFIQDVRLGLFDELLGEYRFEDRPDLVVSITRQGASLVSEAGGQRHLLVSLDQDSLVPRHYDGEGRFRRNRRGKVTHFVYYEFGKRLGIARKTRDHASAQTPVVFAD
ncbi:MAG: RNA polymerase sigma factor [Candidatus Polarisedimenticolia bacterium]